MKDDLKETLHPGRDAGYGAKPEKKAPKKKAAKPAEKE